MTPSTEIRARIDTLRAAMHSQGFYAYMVPTSDPHLSEYPPLYWKGREWLSGYTGSAGTLIVTADFTGLWTDARYWEQALLQLEGSGVTLMKTPGTASTLHLDWLAEHCPPGSVLGVDGDVLGLSAMRMLEAALMPRRITLRTDVDLLQSVWPDRPALPTEPIFAHDAPYASLTRAEKLAQLRREMRTRGAAWHLISTLDDIAWLLNLRGSDVSYNPVFVAHALIDQASVQLFVDAAKVPKALQMSLREDGVELRPYGDTATTLAALPADATVLLDPRRVTLGVRRALPDTVVVVETVNPTTLAKARKSEQDAQHIREAMEQDGAALCEFFAWFEQAVGQERITELTIDEKLTEARMRQLGFVSLSFSTIAGMHANSALPHYRASQERHAVVEGDGFLLIDSGAQYLNGTTDITRVLGIGTPSEAQKQDYTAVLKGVIALSRAQFPRGTRSPLLDVIARSQVWAMGADFGHGVGHGVGYFLNVHEGPQVISAFAAPEPHTAMEPGMLTSVEPGIYRPGKWGVRLENLVLNVPAETTELGEFLKFETMTLCPFDTRCMLRTALRADEIDWLNQYHAKVRARLLPRVEGDAQAWLLARTEPY